MASKEDVARKKSTRWAKASQANYSGDDWSDDDELEEETVPNLPEINIEQYDISAQNTPKLNLEQQFQKIDLDSDVIADEVADQEDPIENTEYTDLIRDDEEDDDADYKPSSEPRFNALPDDIGTQTTELSHERDNEEMEKVQPPEIDLPVSSSNAVDPTPTETVEESAVYIPEDKPKELSDDLDEGEVLQQGLESSTQPEPEPELQHEQTYQLSEQPYEYNDDESDDEQYQERLEEQLEPHGQLQEVPSPLENASISEADQDEYINAARGGDDNSDDEDDEYVPKQYHFQSNSEQFITSNEGDTAASDEPTIDDYTSEEPVYAQEPNSNDQEIAYAHGSEKAIDEPHLSLPTESLGDLSDTDTLHIHDPDSEDASINLDDSHRHIGGVSKNENDSDVKFIKQKSIVKSESAAKNLQDFREHAYLSSIISTPDPNEGGFDDDFPNNRELANDDKANIANDEPESIEVESDESIQDSKPNSSSATPILNRDSQFYSSVNDYFDDYTEEEIQHGTDQNNQAAYKDSDDDIEIIHEKNVNLHPTLSKSSTHSSGSLSTGGPSIRSETGYNRSSKLSDRTTSFTNQSFQDPDDSINPTKTNNSSNSEKPNLNPALSINFGHWRPNTDSFRDQFINDSGTDTLPPVPKLDSYTRNSRGEIVEEVNSIADSQVSDVNSFKNIESITNDDSIDSTFENSANILNKNRDTYRTDSDSVLPAHISLNTPDSSISEPKTSAGNQYFKEEFKEQSTPASSAHTIKKSTKATSYDFKQIATLDNPSVRIERYKKVREDELNTDTGLNDWIKYALNKVDVVNYTYASSSHVKQAYAEASSNPKKFQHNNLGSILVKKTLHDTSSTASSFAKGIFSRGRKMMKNDK